MPKTYALILAGGSGRRFWPLSRDTRPKQLLKLFGDETLLEKAVSRLEGIVPAENILILTNSEQEQEVRKIIGTRLPAENIVAEPAKRDTAPAIALGIGWVAARDPDATMVVLPADQLIRDIPAFQKCMQDAIQAAQLSQALVTIGIKPTWACPGYGYIERGARAAVPGIGDVPLFEVKKFREKPAPELAEQFLQQGHFTWNAGMFIWTVGAAMAELAKHCPELSRFISEVRTTKDLLATIKGQFPALPQISIDYALMEKASRVLNLEASFDWDDVGSWLSVGKYLPQTDNNATNAPLNTIESAGNIIFSSGKRVVLLGVQDMIIVETEDALLVAHKHSADAIKKLVDLVPTDLH